MTEYESFVKRYGEIDLTENEDDQFDALNELDKDIREWVYKKYPELSYLYLEEIADELMDTEEHFIKSIINRELSVYDILDLANISTEEIINNYIKSKNNDN